ncbi:MAG TPA: acyl carrier protein [Burkholderiales bacterium]|nr:acyl carrier protein [Burkholderiales bacterium]
MKDRASVERVVREALQAVRPEGGPLEADAELGLDSTQAMELIMEIEERLDISIPVETFADARTFGELCSGIERLGA